MSSRAVRRRTVRRLVSDRPAYRRVPTVVIHVRLTSPFDRQTVHAIALQPGETRSLTIAALAREVLAGFGPVLPATLVNVPIEVSVHVT